eukprot:COSAG06_NODE_42993_length_376_cov_0.927798_1_plen_115_part_10
MDAEMHAEAGEDMTKPEIKAHQKAARDDERLEKKLVRSFHTFVGTIRFYYYHYRTSIIIALSNVHFSSSQMMLSRSNRDNAQKASSHRVSPSSLALLSATGQAGREGAPAAAKD